MVAFSRLVLPVWLALCVLLATGKHSTAQVAAAPTASPAADDRAARVADRYRAMLQSNPVEGMALDRLWKYHEDLGSTAELIKSYHEASGKENATASTQLIYGHLLKKIGRWEEAAEQYTRAADREPASPYPPLALGDLAAAHDQPEKAAQHYADALGKLPPSDHRRTDLLFKQGSSLLAAGKPDEAAACWEQVAALDPNDFAIRRRLAEAYEQNGLPDRAVAQYEFIRAHADSAPRATALRELSRLHESQGRFDAARTALEDGLTLTARDNWLHGDLLTRLIRLYQRADRTAELAARWRAESENAPRDLGGYLRLKALAEAEGDSAAERAALDRIVALNPRDRDSTLKLAALLAQAGERRRAAGLYDGLLTQQPANLEVLLARAELDVQLGQPAEAARRIEARVAQSPADESVTVPALQFFLGHRLDEPAERLLRAEAGRQPAALESALALAKFLFAQRRTADANAVLAAAVNRPGDAKVRVGALVQIAEAYRQNGLLDEALRTWVSASVLQPNDPAPLLAEADLLRARGDLSGASAKLTMAAELSRPGADRESVERKLFDVLRGESVPDEPGLDAILPGGTPKTPVRTDDSEIGKYLAKLSQQAEQEKTVAAYLHLARWLSWARDPEGALRAAGDALDIEPGNLQALASAADFAIGLRQSDTAERMLAEIVRLDPLHSATAQRQLAGLKLESGEQEEALRLFAGLQALAPGSRTALADLALAQQRTDHWFDAVSTWERAYALPGATPAQRAETRRPLVAAYEHVGQFARAFEVLLRAVDEQTDFAVKEDLLRQTVDLGHQHGLDAQLNAEFETRLRRKPDDFFILDALAQLRRGSGDPAGGYALLQKAQYSSPDPAQSLRGLVREAESLGETGDAVNYQRRLSTLPGQASPDVLGKLADLQEADQNPEDAARTWEDITARFPRDPGALTKAAAFFERSENLLRARELMQTAIGLDPANLQDVLRLASLDARSGDIQAALADYESILSSTVGEAPGTVLTLPEELKLPFDPLALVSGSGRFRLRALGSAPAPAGREAVPAVGGDEALRLQAIAGISRLLFSPDNASTGVWTEARTAWLTRWQKATGTGLHNEPLHAFYYANEKDSTMRLFAALLEKAPPDDSALPGAFVLVGLRLGEAAPVGRWVWSGKDADLNLRVQLMAAGLDRYLSLGGKPGPDLVSGLFPPQVDRQDLLWDAAKQLAGLHWYAPAAELGQRVLALRSSGRDAYASEVAEWELYGGSAERARAALLLSVEEEGGLTLDSHVSTAMSALRQYFLLLPTQERPAFVADYLKRSHKRGNRVQTALAGILLHGLSGDEAAARHDIDILVTTRMLAEETEGPNADVRRWEYLSANGGQLLSWNLDSLAVYLWRQALREANEFVHHSGPAESTILEIRRRLLGAEVALADSPETSRERVAAYLDTNPPPGMAASVAGELLNDTRYSAGIQIFEYLCRVEPRNPDHWRGLFSAYEVAGLPDRTERTLAGLLADGQPLPDGLLRIDFVTRWAAARERCGDIVGACQVLEKERATTPEKLPLLMQLAQTYERAGWYDQAAATWRELQASDPNAAATLGLANAQEHLGQREAAIQTLEGGLDHGVVAGRNEVAARLHRFYLAAPRPKEAADLAGRLLAEGRVDPLPTMAASLAAIGQSEPARQLLASGVLRARDADTRFRLQQALLGLSPFKTDDPRQFLRQIARLETFARDNPSLRNGFEAAKYKMARAAGADLVLEKDLRRRWQDGKGDYVAGERLATLYLETKRVDRLGEVIRQFDHRPMLPDQLLAGLARALIGAGQAPLALPISERLCRRFPQNLDYSLQRATALSKSGQREEAGRVLGALADTAVIHNDVLERIAFFYLEAGDLESARGFFERVVRIDPQAIRSPGSFLQLSRLDLAAGRKADAETLLQTVYRQDAVRDFGPLVDFLEATGQTDGAAALEMPAPDFALSFQRRAALLAAVAARLTKTGHAGEARELLLGHAAFLAELPEAAAELCRNLPESEKIRVAACLRTAAAQIQPPYPRLLRLIAGLGAKPGAADRVAATTQPEPLPAPVASPAFSDRE